MLRKQKQKANKLWDNHSKWERYPPNSSYVSSCTLVWPPHLSPPQTLTFHRLPKNNTILFKTKASNKIAEREGESFNPPFVRACY